MNSPRITAAKLLLRNKLRQSLQPISRLDKRKKSQTITGKVLKHPYFKKAVNIVTYIGLLGEVQTRDLVLKALKMKKNIFIPRIDLARKEIKIYQIRNWKTDLRKRTYGILEPKPAPKRLGDVKQIDLVIAPGLGFDRSGRRLGRGGGYFDRFLSRAQKAKKIGLAFREQIISRIPTGNHDVRMDCVITD